MAKARANKKTTMVALELPECPVCMEIMSAPILQCQSGHSLCHSCTRNLCPPICPICRQIMTQMRNWQLEDMISKAPAPCPNKSLGCKFTVIGAEMENHLKECIFRDMQCPLGLVFGRCSWSGQLKDIMGHFRENHPQNCKIQLDTVVDIDQFSITADDRFMYLISMGKYNFIATIKIDTCQKMVFWVVQLIGSKSSAQKYTYEINVISKQENRRQVIFSDQCYNDTYNVNDIFRQAKCGVMPLNMLNHFVKDRKVSIRISITNTQPKFKNASKNHENNVNMPNNQGQNRQNEGNQFRSKSPGPQFRPKNFKNVPSGPSFKGPKQQNKNGQ